MAAKETARRRTAATATTAPATVAAFLARYADHFSLVPATTAGDDSAATAPTTAQGTAAGTAAGSGRVRCTITGHEMPARLDVLQEHLRSKKYLLATAKLVLTAAPLPAHIVASEQHTDKVYCNLTGRLLNKTAKQIEDHVNGRRYKKALAHWERTGEYPHQTRARLAQAKREQEKAGDEDEDGEFWKPDDDEDGEEDSEEDGEEDGEEDDSDDEDGAGNEDEEDKDEEQDEDMEEEEEVAEQALSGKGQKGQKKRANAVDDGAGRRPAATTRDDSGEAATETRGLGPFFKKAPVQSGKKKAHAHNTSAWSASAASVPGSRDQTKRPHDELESGNAKRGRRA